MAGGERRQPIISGEGADGLLGPEVGHDENRVYSVAGAPADGELPGTTVLLD